MANNLKKITALALVMILVLSVMNFGPIFKAVEVSAATINIPLDFTAGSKTPHSGDGWHWDGSTLTLFGIHLVTSGTAITVSLDTTILLVGENTVVSESFIGIYGDNIIISGDGSLSITSERAGISAKDSVTIDGGMVKITSGDIGIYAAGTITIAGGTVVVDSDYSGIYADGNITIAGGTVMVDSYYGIFAVKSIAINAGVVMVDSLYYGIIAYGSITIAGGTVVVDSDSYGIRAISSIAIAGGAVMVDSLYYGIYADDTIMIADGEFDISAGLHGMYAAHGDITIDDGSGFIKTIDPTGKYAAVVAHGELTHHHTVLILGHDGEAYTLFAKPGPFNSQTFVDEDGAHHTNIMFGYELDDDKDDDKDIDSGQDDDKDDDEDDKDDYNDGDKEKDKDDDKDDDRDDDKDKDDDNDNDKKKDDDMNDPPTVTPPADPPHIHDKSHHESDEISLPPLVRRTASGQIVHYWEDRIDVHAVGSDTELNHMVLIHYRYFPGRVAVNDADIEIFGQFTPGYRNIDGILALRITLLASFLETLPVGRHKMEIFLREESVIAYFYVAEQEAEVDASIAVTVSPWINPFEDVRSNDWFYSDVQYVHERGLMIGTSLSPRLFSPHMTTTRGMFVTLLYRIAGTPSVSGLYNPFSDVEQGKWYTDAVIWAAANGIINSGEAFGAMEALTREQMAVMMANFISHMGCVLPSSEVAAFADQDEISPWAHEAIHFMQAAGIIQGRPGNVFDPQGTATRAEVAAIIHRFLEMIEA